MAQTTVLQQLQQLPHPLLPAASATACGYAPTVAAVAAANALNRLVPKTNIAQSLQTECVAMATIAILDEECARFSTANLSEEQQMVLHSFVDTVKQRIAWTVAARTALSI